MSAENVAVVERFESLMGARSAGSGLDEVLELLDENVVFRPTETVPGHGGEWIGHEGFLRMCRAYGEVWETPRDFRYEVLDGGGDTVVILASFIRTARETGRSIPIRMVEIVTVRDGRITELVPYFYDTVPMVEAVRTTA